MAKPDPFAFPWREAMGFACRTLRYTPEQFWALTPRELAELIQAAQPAADAPSRREFDALLAACPPQETQNG